MVNGVPLDRFTIHGLALGLALAICCILLEVGGPVGGPESQIPLVSQCFRPELLLRFLPAHYEHCLQI